MLRDIIMALMGACSTVIVIALIGVALKWRERAEMWRRLPEDTGELAHNDFTATMHQSRDEYARETDRRVKHGEFD